MTQKQQNLRAKTAWERYEKRLEKENRRHDKQLIKIINEYCNTK